MNKRIGAGVIAIILIIIAIVAIRAGMNAWIAEQNERTLLTIDLKIAEQEILLSTLADLARRTDADEITKQIIVDCTSDERQRFDSLLNKLSATITMAELRELDTLFYKCGSFYADRKAVMSARLLREVGVYDDYIALRSSLISADDAKLKERAALWMKLADSELAVANHFRSLVRLQGDIISSLIAGEQRDSAEITATLKEVKETRDMMTILSQQIENYRNQVQTLE